MDAQVGLPVAVEVERPQRHAARDRLLVDAGRDRLASPDHLAREADVDGEHHPTTQACLRALSRVDVAGKRVADVGTGSAILAIACAKRGAREVLALDIDAVAVKEAKANVERNAVSIEARVGSAADLDGAYDLVLANIVAAVLQKLAHELAAHLAPGATLIVAGIIAAEEAETVGAFTAEGLRAIDREQAGDWVALQLTA